jgi:hypothetical protein
MAGVIEGTRAALLGAPAMPWDLILVGGPVAVALAVTGTLVFRRERLFADEAFGPWLTADALVAFHDTAWELYRDHPRYRADIGVLRYMQELEEMGYPSITLPTIPGITVMHPRPGGFDFLQGILDRAESPACASPTTT